MNFTDKPYNIGRGWRKPKLPVKASCAASHADKTVLLDLHFQPQEDEGTSKAMLGSMTPAEARSLAKLLLHCANLIDGAGEQS